ncbi:Ca2+-dependent phosphoinositide-specific phospholipase C, partial [Burkholderia sp. SIMBA_051]
VDVQSHCVLFSDCLNNLKKWSQANPLHYPIVVMINVKETGTSIDPQPPTLKFKASDYHSLDAVIKQTLSDSLFTPDNLRK